MEVVRSFTDQRLIGSSYDFEINWHGRNVMIGKMSGKILLIFDSHFAFARYKEMYSFLDHGKVCV